MGPYLRQSAMQPFMSRRLCYSALRFGAVAVYCASATSIPAPAFGQADVESRFRTEYPNAALDLEGAVANIHCAGVRTVDGRVTRTEFFVRGDSWLSVLNYDSETAKKRDAVAQVNCRVPHYSFQLQKLSDERPFLIREHSNDDQQMVRTRRVLQNELGSFVFGAFQIDAIAVKDMLAEPQFRVIRASHVSKDGEQLVEVDFDLSETRFWVQSGQIVFSPSRRWAISRYEVLLKPDGSGARLVRAGTVSYTQWPAGDFVFPKSVQINDTVTVEGKERKHSRRMEFDSVKFGTLGDEEFKLTAFGLPDVPFSAQRGVFGKWQFWALSIIIVVLSAALWRRRMPRIAS